MLVTRPSIASTRRAAARVRRSPSSTACRGVRRSGASRSARRRRSVAGATRTRPNGPDDPNDLNPSGRPRLPYTAVMRSVADQLRLESRQTLARMTAAERIELALRPGDSDVASYGAAHGVSAQDARVAL